MNCTWVKGHSAVKYIYWPTLINDSKISNTKTLVDFICSNNKRIIVTTNKIAVLLDFNIMKKYIKKLNNVNLSDIMSPRLL